VPFKRGKSFEECSRTVFILAMCMAGRCFQTEQEEGSGKPAVRVMLNGIDHIVVFSHCPGATAPDASGEKEQQFQKETLAKDTLDHMEMQNFRECSWPETDMIRRAVIVTAGETDALAVFGETENRSPEGGEGG
jgi:hypothetical protein